MRISLLLLAALPLAAQTVAVTGGRIQGAVLESGGAVFKGIPFARAERWQPPEAPRPWTRVREAKSFGPPCAQNLNGRMQAGSSEDCLFLNVWTPEWPAASRLPVMVWFHGGGNYAGTASSDNFDGASLARHGVVVVTANYRLGIFGFFAHPELTRASPRKASGNYGLMDQIAALGWVKTNIAQFGGDPGNVTIFGQSAGAVDVNALMTSLLAAGLFHKVIAQSGTVARNPDAATMAMIPLGNLMPVREGPLALSDAATLAEAEKAGLAIGASLAALRSLVAGELLAKTTGPRMAIGPANGVIVDGYVIPQAPAEVFAAGRQARLPLLIGNNSRERSVDVAADPLHAAMRGMYGPLAPRAMELYAAPDPFYGNVSTQWVVDTLYRCPVVAQLVWHTGAGNAGYEYEFDRPGGAAHGAEVPYVFGRVSHAVSPVMQQYWTNFARTGDPNGEGLPRWPRFDVTSHGFLQFLDSGPVAREDLRRPFCDLYVENTKRLMPK
jgi:para-nitrobenzyl esterase